MSSSMATKPNFLFIMADDHAAKAISCYGAEINHTPNLDQLAEQGMRFNHCYVTNSICTPSRAAILTGTHNHVNGVRTLASSIDNRLPNVAKQLRAGAGYQTAMIGKWHLGEGKEHEPTGFDFWSVLPGQGDYHDPQMIEMGKPGVEKGYATDIITDKSIRWLQDRDRSRPFFLMCHHKAPHRSWECHHKYKDLFKDRDIQLPDTFTDEYKNRAKAARVAKMRVADDLTYGDLGLVQPEGGDDVGELMMRGWYERKIPNPNSDKEVKSLRLIDRETGGIYTFSTRAQLAEFKFQRYMKRYLRTVASIDENVGRLLDFLDHDLDPQLANNTVVIYTSDQGFFLGEHGWFDKRFMYEESFQMPFLIRFPAQTPPRRVCDDIICNVDFAPTFLELASVRIPSYMQGVSFRPLLQGRPAPSDWQQVAYHRYWMHRDAIHNAYAHYGVRDHRYKLIYWYNDGLGLEGTQPGDQDDEKEWELFDCQEDPLELFNCYHDPQYRGVVLAMTKKLEDKMLEIGDEPMHVPGEVQLGDASQQSAVGWMASKFMDNVYPRNR